MNKEKFSNIVSSPLGLEKETVKELQEVVDNFPYCQTARVLVAKGQHDIDSMLAHGSIKKASLYSIDRKNLKHFIESKRSPEIVNPTKEETNVIEEHLSVVPDKEESPITSDIEIKDEAIAEETPTVEDKDITPNVNLEVSASANDNNEDQPENTPEESSPFLSEVEKNLAELRKAKEKANEILDHEAEELQKVSNAKKSSATTPETPPKKEAPKETKPGVEKSEIEKSTAEEKNKSSIPKEKVTNNPPKKKSKPKAADKTKKADFPKLNLQDDKIGFDIFSSRFGEVLKEKEDTTLEYTRDFHPDLYLLTRTKAKPKQKPKVDTTDIIEKFISTEPSITPIKDKKTAVDPTVDLSAKSSTLKAPIVSENLARIYSKQGNNKKAIAIYEALILKYPEKKTYFADQISKLK